MIAGTGDEGIGTPEQWLARMSRDREHVDNIFIRLTSGCVNRQIILHSVIREDQTGLQTFEPRDYVAGQNPPIFMLLFNQTRFGVGHYQVQSSFFLTRQGGMVNLYLLEGTILYLFFSP